MLSFIVHISHQKVFRKLSPTYFNRGKLKNIKALLSLSHFLIGNDLLHLRLNSSKKDDGWGFTEYHVSSLHDDALAHWPEIIFNFEEFDQIQLWILDLVGPNSKPVWWGVMVNNGR